MTHSNTTDVTTKSLSIREFARYYGHAEAVVRRAMRQISVRGMSQGRGRPTLLSPEHQEQLLHHIEAPVEREAPIKTAQAVQAVQAAESLTAIPVEPAAPDTPMRQTSQSADLDTDTCTCVSPDAGNDNLNANPHSAPEYELSISLGNHRMTVETPEIPHSYDLGQFRGEEVVPAIADPGEIASQAMAAIDSLVAGMDADIRQQRSQLTQTQNAAKALRRKAKRLHEKRIEYMIQSSAIGQAQRQSTADLQEALGEVQALGKSPRSEQEPPSSSR